MNVYIPPCCQLWRVKCLQFPHYQLEGWMSAYPFPPKLKSEMPTYPPVSMKGETYTPPRPCQVEEWNVYISPSPPVVKSEISTYSPPTPSKLTVKGEMPTNPTSRVAWNVYKTAPSPSRWRVKSLHTSALPGLRVKCLHTPHPTQVQGWNSFTPPRQVEEWNANRLPPSTPRLSRAVKSGVENVFTP